MTRRPTVELGSFVVGEIPAPLEYQFLTDLGDPLDLTGFTTARFQWGLHGTGGEFTNPVDRAATVSNAVNGEVTYAWVGDEFTVTGPHAGLLHVTNNVTQYASLLLTWSVCSTITTPP